MSGRAFGCGQCFSCKVNKRRTWTNRILLEASTHPQNVFVTLTYAEENLPADGSLCPEHLRNYLKRLRRKMEPHRFRFFAVGEYGDDNFRPHYHLILFGMPNCNRGVTLTRRNRPCCPVCQLHVETWGKGNVYLGGVSDQSAAYTCGYAVKKMTKADDPRLEGRHPEFARMSNRPGIGEGFMHEVASTLLKHGLDELLVDVPTALGHGKKLLPLGRYLTRRLRVLIGRDPNTPKEVLNAREEELRLVREAAFLTAVPGQKTEAFRQALIDQAEGSAIRLAAREKRLRKKGSI